MFINCKHCGTLVATDPVTDLPPERCPRCRGALRAPDAQATPSVATLLKPVPASAAPAPPTTLPPAPAAPIKPIEPIAPSPAPVAPSQSGEDASASDVAEARAGASVSAAPVDSVPTAAVAPPAPASPSPPELAPMVTVPDRRSPNRLPGPGIPRASPSFVRRMRSGGTGESRRQRHLLIAGVAALSLLLVLQVLLADRERAVGLVNRMLAEGRWRPELVRHDDWPYHLHGWNDATPIAELDPPVKPVVTSQYESRSWKRQPVGSVRSAAPSAVPSNQPPTQTPRLCARR